MDDGKIQSLPVNPSVNAVEVPIVLLCSDARLIGNSYYQAKDEIIPKLLGEGVLVDFNRILDPGAFMTPLTTNVMKKIIREKENLYENYLKKGIPVKYNVHVISHGNVEPAQSLIYSQTYVPYYLQIANHCTNCGMQDAKNVAASLQDFILEAPRKFIKGGKEFIVDSVASLQEYLRFHFRYHGVPRGWDGNLVNLVENVEDIRMHPGKQIKKFEENIRMDGKFSSLLRRINTYGHVFNMKTCELYRADGKAGQEDMVISPIFHRLKENIEELKAKGESEYENMNGPHMNPVFVISNFSTQKTRLTAMTDAYHVKYLPGMAFGLSSGRSMFNFDSNSLLGFFYAFSKKYLNSDNYGKLVIIAKDPRDYGKLSYKINHDELARLVVDSHVKETHIIIGNKLVDSRHSFPNGRPDLPTGQRFHHPPKKILLL